VGELLAAAGPADAFGGVKQSGVGRRVATKPCVLHGAQTVCIKYTEEVQ